jgi:hypothetical protein
VQEVQLPAELARRLLTGDDHADVPQGVLAFLGPVTTATG